MSMSSVVSLLVRALILLDQGLTTLFNLNYLLKTLSSNSIRLGVGLQHRNFGGDTIQYIAVWFCLKIRTPALSQAYQLLVGN